MSLVPFCYCQMQFYQSFSFMLLVIFVYLCLGISQSFIAQHTNHEVRNYCLSSLPSSDDLKLKVRNAQIRDLEKISILCSYTFEPDLSDFPWFGGNKRKQSISNYFNQLYERKIRYVEKGLKHSMLVAVLNTYSDSDQDQDQIVGFTEVGMLPSPLGPIEVDSSCEETAVNVDSNIDIDAREEIDDIHDKKDNCNDDIDADQKNENNDVPYLGNVAVDSRMRRKGIATKLIRVASRVAEKWNDANSVDKSMIYATVECSNNDAMKLYEKLGFSVVLDERDLISRRQREPRLFMRRMLFS